MYVYSNKNIVTLLSKKICSFLHTMKVPVFVVLRNDTVCFRLSWSVGSHSNQCKLGWAELGVTFTLWSQNRLMVLMIILLNSFFNFGPECFIVICLCCTLYRNQRVSLAELHIVRKLGFEPSSVYRVVKDFTKTRETAERPWSRSQITFTIPENKQKICYRNIAK